MVYTEGKLICNEGEEDSDFESTPQQKKSTKKQVSVDYIWSCIVYYLGSLEKLHIYREIRVRFKAKNMKVKSHLMLGQKNLEK